LVFFCLVATSALHVMEIYAGSWPGQGQAFLTRLRAWTDSHTDQVIIIVSVVLGFWLIDKCLPDRHLMAESLLVAKRDLGFTRCE